MSTFRVQIRLNVRPEAGATFVEHVGPLAKQAGLRLRNDAPGLIEGDAVSLIDLGALMVRLGELPGDWAAASDIVGAGLVDDVWIHLTRERDGHAPGQARRS